MGKIIKYILSFILMVCIIASSLIGVVKNTVASKEYCINKLEEISFYDKIKDEIEDTFKNYILQSGMDETVLQNLFEKEKLKQDINNLVDAIYENKEINIETESIKEKLNENIDNYLNEKGLKITNQNEVDIFVDTIAETYESGIVYSMSAIKQATPITAKLINIIQKITPIAYIATIVLAIILIISNLKIKSDIAKYIGISMLSAGTILSIIKIYITSQINIEGISIMNEVITELIKNVANQVLNNILYLGIAIAVIGLILIIVKILSIKEEK